MIVYRILPNGYFGGIETIEDDSGGIPFGTTWTPVPNIPEGSFAEWNGTGWTITDIPPVDESLLNVVPDVQVVSMRQARYVLFKYGYLDSVSVYINQLPSPDKELAQIDWDCATEVRKDAGLVAQLSQFLQLTPETVDKLFYEASLIL